MRIAEVARRSGLPATTLRYYESLGLLSVRRGPNGYRDYDYDSDVLTRLDLIEASKELGLSLEEVAGHLGVMGEGSCTQVRDHLHPLLVQQVARIEAKLVALEQLRHRLSTAEVALAGCPDRSESCATECVLAPARA
ncbi:MerR family transcriptional regulator [Kineococcus sp. R86509]|uniref:MerR family transcriptional regulator n=1 Tax=Kineococcus sp. R86509 TaxID=3093851 RepID=UPI0036D3CE03